MPTFPPSVDVRNDATMQHLANAFRASTNAGSDFLNTTVASLHPLMVVTMKRYGLDASNRFGFGSSAQKAADSVCAPLKRAAEHLVDAGQLVGFAYLAFIKNVWTPIQMAKAAQESGKRQTLDV